MIKLYLKHLIYETCIERIFSDVFNNLIDLSTLPSINGHYLVPSMSGKYVTVVQGKRQFTGYLYYDEYVHRVDLYDTSDFYMGTPCSDDIVVFHN